MSSSDKCGECGTVIPDGSPGGLCGPCLLALGLEHEQAMPHVTASDVASASLLQGDEQAGRLVESLPEALDASKAAARIVPLTEKPGDTIGRYKLLEQIGEGGMGIVWMAEQEQPVRRRVALKVIKLGMDTKQVVGRFEAERQALALMDHSNIAKVLDAGATETGRPYFVMELVRGIKITDFCDEGNLATRERLDLFVQVCQAIQHAHQKGIIHRDIKPFNILVTVNDGVPVPKVIDFGIAKATQGRLTDKTLFTAFEQFLGTPAYMSPEQAVMTSLDIDTRSDIYSLGVLLYELLTGQTPFDARELLAAGLDAMRRIILEKEPPPPSTRLIQELVAADELKRLKFPVAGEPRSAEEIKASSRRALHVKELLHLIRGDLDWIVMKCLEKDRTRRYETANGLARDIQRHLNHEAITARPISQAGKLWRWCRRQPALSALGAAVLLLLITLAVGSSVAAWRIDKARTAERLEREQSEEARSQLALSLTQMELREIHRAAEYFEAGDHLKALAYLALVLRQTPTNRIAAQRLMSVLSEMHFARPVIPPLQHADRLTWAQFSRDGRLIVTTSADATAKVWDAATGRLAAGPFKHELEVNSAEFSPDGQWLVTASKDKTARVWEIRTGRPLSPPLLHQGDVSEAHFSPDGEWVATASSDNTARVWDARTGIPRFQPLRHGRVVASAEFSPDGKSLLTASYDHTARIWDAVTGQPQVTFKHNGRVTSAHFSPDGQRVLTASCDNTARVWDASTGEPISPPLQHRDWVGSAEFSPDGQRVATASLDATARLWDVRTGQPICPPLPHLGPVRSALFSPDGQKVITTSWDNTARVWDARTGYLIIEPLVHDAHVYYAEFHPDDQRVVTACSGTSAQVWDVSAIQSQSNPRILSRTHHLNSADFSPDGTRVVTASDYEAEIWDLAAGPPLRKPLASATGFGFAEFSRDGTLVVTAGTNHTAQVWDAHTAAPVGQPLKHDNQVRCAHFAPDGDRVVTASEDGTARVWDAHTGKAITSPLRHEGPVNDAQFSPDGRTVVSASKDKTARTWDALTGQTLLPSLQHAREVQSAQFSPDGRLILTAAQATAQVWDARTAQRLGLPLQHLAPVCFASFSPDGSRVFTGSLDGTVRTWEARTGRALTTVLAHKSRLVFAQLSPDGQRLVTASKYGIVRVWDVETGLPLTEPLPVGSDTKFAKFSPDGQRVLAISKDDRQEEVRLWDMPVYPLPVPAWVPELAEALAGQQVDARGRSEFVSCQVTLQLKQKLEQSPTQDAYGRWARWFFALDSPRAISPGSHANSQE